MVTPIIRENQNTTRLINHLKQLKTQYPCLTKEQERELIEKHRDNRAELNRLLFMHNIRIVIDQAKRYMGSTADFDNMVQNGMLGLAIAAERFDIDRNIKFITAATPWVRKYILSEFYNRQVEVDKRSTSLNSIINYSTSKSSNDSLLTVENYIQNEIDSSFVNIKTTEDEINSDELKNVYSLVLNKVNLSTELSAQDKAIFNDVFRNNEKIKSVSKKYNLTTGAVTKIKKRLIDFCKTFLRDDLKIESMADICS